MRQQNEETDRVLRSLSHFYAGTGFTADLQGQQAPSRFISLLPHRQRLLASTAKVMRELLRFK